MQRITLNKPWRTPISMRLGAESVAPMDYGAYSPELAVEFRRGRPKSQEKPRTWTMDYYDESKSIIVPNEVSVFYFGDPRAGSDQEAVEMKLIPSFNFERQRVADVWGGYFYSAKHGLYSTAKIAVPNVPDVTIENVNNSGTTVGDFSFEPLKFWRFEELLDANAAEEMAEIEARRGKKSFALDLDSVTPEQLDELAERLGARLERRKVAAGK